ncbi:hypothetical protein IGI04_008383, partial [Brassica rapa subsp. trilocularis]
VKFCVHESLSGVGVPHGVLGDIWMHLELKGGEIGDHWTSRAWERAQSDLPKATHRGRSHLTPLSEQPPKATPRGRSRLYGETTRSEARSDLSERPTEVAPEGRSDLSERHAEVAPRLLLGRFLFYLRAFWSFHYGPTRGRLSLDLLRNIQKLSGEVHLLDFDCYVLVFLLSEYLHSRCFDISQNWFDNHLYYNICLRSLENS